MRCTRVDWTSSHLDRFERVDVAYPGRGADASLPLRSLDASPCLPFTREGIVSTRDGTCVDLGVGNNSRAYGGWPLFFLPRTRLGMYQPPSRQVEKAASLRARLESRQFPGACRRGLSYFVNEVPLVGFGSVIEYAMMFLARANTMRAQLVLGSQERFTRLFFSC